MTKQAMARLQQIAESEIVYLPYYFLLAFECHRTDGADVMERTEDLKTIILGVN
jgi:hypothetical protein